MVEQQEAIQFVYRPKMKGQQENKATIAKRQAQNERTHLHESK